MWKGRRTEPKEDGERGDQPPDRSALRWARVRVGCVGGREVGPRLTLCWERSHAVTPHMC